MSAADFPKIKRTRRKPIKSCTFCRKRKLRCDQKKPICSACSQRNLTDCTYVTGILKEPTTSGIDTASKMSTREDLNRMIAVLEDQLKKAQSRVENTINPMREMYYFQTKKSGRKIWYGPTAVMSLVGRTYWGTSENFSQLWVKVNTACKQLKAQNGQSMLKENALVEEPIGESYTSGLPVNIIQETCAVLPSFETIRRTLITFFENKQLYEVNDTLDKDKVLSDFENGFVPGPLMPLTSERPIVNLLPSEKKNYYKVSVVIAILQLVYYRSDIPPAIGRFLVFLTGLSTAKVMYIERIQMQFLRLFYRVTHCGTEDASHTMILGNSIIQEAMRMGLNHEIRDLFKDQEKDVGRLDTVENLWSWVCFADFDIALLSGSPLQIHPDFIYDESFFADESKTDQGLLKRYLNMVRPMQYAVTAKYGKPPLEAYCETLIDFTEAEFPPIWHFTEAEDVHKTSTMKKRILSHLLSVLIALLGLRFTAYGEKTHQLKNATLVSSLIALAFSINLITCAYKQDARGFPDLLKQDSKGIGPYLYQAISVAGKLLSRTLPTFYGMAYHKLTMFENGLLLGMEQSESACDLKALKIPPGVHISIMTSFEMFQNMLDQLLKEEELKGILLRSRVFKVLLTMERVGRVIINKVLQYRTSAENTWISQSRKSTTRADSSMERPASTDETPLPVSSAVNPATQDNQHETVLLSTPQLKGMAPGDDPIGDNDPDMAFSISEEFWTHYNLRWEEYMNNEEYNQLFTDFLPH